MTAQELGLPPRFEQAMKRRMGQTGIFVDVGGKYYLDETRLNQFSQEWMRPRQGGRQGLRTNMMTLRVIRMVLGVAIVLIFFVNLVNGRGTVSWYLVAALIVVWIAISVFQIYYLSRMRGMMRSRFQNFN